MMGITGPGDAGSAVENGTPQARMIQPSHPGTRWPWWEAHVRWRSSRLL